VASIFLSVACLTMLSGSADSAHALPSGELQAQHVYLETHSAMGTIFSLYLYADSEDRARSIAQTAFDEVDRVDALLSNYQESSELSRINREASHHAVITDGETFAFLQTSLLWSAKTSGGFDITVGRLMKAWGFFRSQGRVPTDAELVEVGKQVGWRKVILVPRERSVRFDVEGLELDPGGIGKGYVVDRMAELLRSQNITAALISAGSSTIYAIGAPPGEKGWKVQVPDPEGKPREVSTVILRDTSLSTSACTEKYFLLNGHRYCHIMDPHTLRPVEGMLQTSVIDPSATSSDALSASLFVLGPEAGRELLRGLPEASAIIFTGREHVRGCAAIRWPDVAATDVCHAVIGEKGRRGTE
jgi:FAD:protein FMN transferase